MTRNGMVATSLENVIEPDDVRLDIGIGICDAIAHASLCRKVDHNIEAVVGK